MNNSNFGKDIRNLTEDELFFNINNHDSKFSILCQYELMRRISIKNELSSKRFAESSFYLAIVSILISFAIGTVQIYLMTF